MIDENIGADVLMDGERSRWDCRRCSHGCRLLDSHEEEDVLQVAGDDGRSQVMAGSGKFPRASVTVTRHQHNAGPSIVLIRHHCLC